MFHENMTSKVEMKAKNVSRSGNSDTTYYIFGFNIYNSSRVGHAISTMDVLGRALGQGNTNLLQEHAVMTEEYKETNVTKNSNSNDNAQCFITAYYSFQLNEM